MGILSDTQPGNASSVTGGTATAPAQTSDAGGGLIGGLFNAVTGGITSHIANAIFAGSEDQRQYNQQAKLQGLQIQGAQQMADYQQQEQMKTWYETNYPAQVQQLEQAGLNPALLYGGGGGSGASLGSGAAAMPTGATASDAASRQNAGTNAATMGLMLAQQKLMAAQTDAAEATANNQNSQADLNKNQTPANITADTALKGQQTQTLLQGITNQQAQAALTQAQTTAQNVANHIATETQDAAIQTAIQAAQASVATTRSAFAQANVDEATQKTKIDMIQQIYTNAITDNVVKQAQANNTDADTALKQFQISLTKQGIDPSSPWYVKMIADLENKMRINSSQTTANTLKQ